VVIKVKQSEFLDESRPTPPAPLLLVLLLVLLLRIVPVVVNKTPITPERE